jgi:hypothetical protein
MARKEKGEGKVMIPDFTYRARSYVNQSPQTKSLADFNKSRLIRGIAKLPAWAYKEGFAQGVSHADNCDCPECKWAKKRQG